MILKGISVIVCCYNSITRLPNTLKHLANQKISSFIQYEVIIVDNNSDDSTGSFAQTFWNKLDSPVSFQVVKESKAGLSYAREKGIATAKYEYIVFCDDDNWLDEKYLAYAYSIMNSHPKIGVLGGVGSAISNTELPHWFSTLESFYAVGKQNSYQGNIQNKPIYGAGLIMRKSVFLKAKTKGFKSLLTDRTKTSLASGGDSEICLIMRLLGYEIWYDERLKFQHFIPKNRLNKDYIQKLSKANSHVLFVSIIYLHQIKNYPVNLLFYILFGVKFLIKFLVYSFKQLHSPLYKQVFIIQYLYLRYYYKNWKEYKNLRLNIIKWVQYPTHSK